MKQFMLIATVVLFSFVAVPAFAQVTGPNIVVSIGNQLSNQPAYVVEQNNDGMHLRDASTGNEVVAVQEKGSQCVTITGIVAQLNRLSPEERQRALQRIALFNFSSPVGTLVVDPSTGEVRMEHNLNPRQVSIPVMAQVTTMMSDSVRTQSQLLVQ